MWGARGLKEHEDYFRAEDIGLSGHTIPANLDAYYPRPIFSEGGKNQEIQTRYLQDASYIRLKKFPVRLYFPGKMDEKYGVDQMPCVCFRRKSLDWNVVVFFV